MLRVHHLEPPAAEFLVYLRSKLLPGIDLSWGGNSPIPEDTRILVAGRPQREHILACPSLERLIIPWAGLPAETRRLMLDFPHITVHNLHHNAGAAAEMALALLLAAAKYIVPLDRSLRNHDWTPRYRPSPALLLEGRTALILGYGAIGRRVAAACRQLGMTTLAVKRHPEISARSPVAIYPTSALPALLPQAQALIICLPHTPKPTA